MTVPDVGPLVALTYAAGVGDAGRFSDSRTVEAHFGLTPRRAHTDRHRRSLIRGWFRDTRIFTTLTDVTSRSNPAVSLGFVLSRNVTHHRPAFRPRIRRNSHNIQGNAPES